MVNNFPQTKKVFLLSHIICRTPCESSIQRCHSLFLTFKNGICLCGDVELLHTQQNKALIKFCAGKLPLNTNNFYKLFQPIKRAIRSSAIVEFFSHELVDLFRKYIVHQFPLRRGY